MFRASNGSYESNFGAFGHCQLWTRSHNASMDEALVRPKYGKDYIPSMIQS
jgi:hypothetical protein